jgi:hypothetical protein
MISQGRRQAQLDGVPEQASPLRVARDAQAVVGVGRVRDERVPQRRRGERARAIVDVQGGPPCGAGLVHDDRTLSHAALCPNLPPLPSRSPRCDLRKHRSDLATRASHAIDADEHNEPRRIARRAALAGRSGELCTASC